MNLQKLSVLFLIISSLSGCIVSDLDKTTPVRGLGNKINYDSVENRIKAVEQNLNARVGAALYDVKSGKELWSYKGNLRFPMMSTFKTLAFAKALFDEEEGRLSFDTSVIIDKSSLITWSPVTENYVGKSFSLNDACNAMMVMSDNTAANIVLEKTGGPKGLTGFIRSIGDNISRLDRMEPDLGEALDGDERDTTTPSAIVKTLDTLVFGDVLSEDSKKILKQLMMDNKVSDSLLRSVLPMGWTIADRSGAGGYGSRGITAIVWSEKESPLIISIYLTQTKASFDQRNKAIAEIGREIFALYEDNK